MKIEKGVVPRTGMERQMIFWLIKVVPLLEILEYVFKDLLHLSYKS